MAIKTKGVSIVGGFGLISLVLSLAGCGNIPGRYAEVFPNPSPTVEVTPIPTKTLTPTIPPTPTETPTPTPTVEPSPTPEPTAENFSYSSSINPDRLATVQADITSSFNDHSLDMTDKFNYPLVVVKGYPVAYNLERDEHGTQLFVLLATTGGGLIKANVEVFNFGDGSWPETMYEIDRIDDKEAGEISSTIDNYIKQINEGGKFMYYMHYIILTAINTKADSKACLVNYRGLENAERLCAYDASNETLTPNIMLSKIEDSIILTKGKNPQDALNLESYPALSSEGNMYVGFQL
ncbi:MAG: hypothetical protein ACYC6K_13215 [Bellilinea sp.]